jgi:plastocyanin
VRKLVQVVPISIAMLILLMAVSPALASRGPTISVLGGNTVKINQRLLSTFHFGPGTLHVMPGEVVTFQNTGPCSIDCDHTISIVNVSQLPGNLTQIFRCLIDQPGTVCVTIIGAHFPQGPGGQPNLRVNVPGEPSGFQGANSLLIAHGQTLEVTITAQSGTTIHFMCAFHPWMQASIIVGNDDINSES